MRVTGPREFEGAMIEGHVSQVERSGRLTGRSVLTLDFDSIRLRDGRSYQFGGIVEEVRETDGDIVRVDTEGTVRDDNQTSRTTTRTAIGTAVGAIIGAIAGGGKGAAIGPSSAQAAAPVRCTSKAETISNFSQEPRLR